MGKPFARDVWRTCQSVAQFPRSLVVLMIFDIMGALQLEMGHRSANLLLSRYLNLPQVKQAKAYWNLS